MRRVLSRIGLGLAVLATVGALALLWIWGETRILTDGFFSRPGALSVVRDAEIEPDVPGIFFRPAEVMKLHNLNMHLPWIDLVQGGIEIHRVPGNHLTMNFAPNVKVLAGHLRRAISSVAVQSR